jgi:hypothetical protein
VVAWQRTKNSAHCSGARCLLCVSAVNASHGRVSHSVIFVPSVIVVVKPSPFSTRYTKIHETTVENRQLIEDKARAHFCSLRNSTFLKIRRRPDEGLRAACSEARREVVSVWWNPCTSWFDNGMEIRPCTEIATLRFTSLQFTNGICKDSNLPHCEAERMRTS